SNDAVLVFSVGGGSREHNVSMNVVHALDVAHTIGAPLFAIVGRADGAAAQIADICIVLDPPPERRTPHVEEFQAILWHLLVPHPALAKQSGKWETVDDLIAPAS